MSPLGRLAAPLLLLALACGQGRPARHPFPSPFASTTDLASCVLALGEREAQVQATAAEGQGRSGRRRRREESSVVLHLGLPSDRLEGFLEDLRLDLLNRVARAGGRIARSEGQFEGESDGPALGSFDVEYTFGPIEGRVRGHLQRAETGEETMPYELRLGIEEQL